MSSVWYIGRSGIRLFTAEDWARVGIATTQTHTWSSENGWSIPHDQFTTPMLDILDSLYDFTPLSPDGPRELVSVPATGSSFDAAAYYYGRMRELLDEMETNGLTPEAFSNAVGNKVDKIATTNTVYATGGAGVPAPQTYTSNPTAYTLAYRGPGGTVRAGDPDGTSDDHAVTKRYLDKQSSVRPGGYRSGYYYRCNTAPVTTTSGHGFNALRVSPWIVTAPVNIVALFMQLIAPGDASSVIRVGVWNDDGTGSPNNLFFDAGNFSTAGAAGVIEKAAVFTLQPGIYWVGGQLEGSGTQPQLQVVAQAGSTLQIPYGATLPNSMVAPYSVARGGTVNGVLANPFGTVSGSANISLAVGFKTAAS